MSLYAPAQCLDVSGSERLVDQSAQAGVVGRIAHQHHMGRADDRGVLRRGRPKPANQRSGSE